MFEAFDQRFQEAPDYFPEPTIKCNMKKLYFILLFILSLQFEVNAQVYLHDFGTTTISAHPYTVAPGTLDPNLSNSSWTNSTGAWTSFAGVTGQAISLSNSSGNPVLTLTFDVSPGCNLDITAIDFWRRRSSTGAQNWSVDINGTNVASGTTPTTTGSYISFTPITGMTGLTGTVTIDIALSGATGTGTFRLDDFTLYGSTSCSSNTITIGAVTGPFSVDCAVPTSASGSVNFTSSGTFNPGNIYTAQLSDASGNFGTPTNIGSLTSTANFGIINFTIPSGMAGGTGYRMRILSDNPVVSSDTTATFTITQTGTCVPTTPTTAGLIINEWSNGPSGNQEYYEFVVAGQCGETADIRGYILDDNNGTFTNPADYSTNASGIAPGHFRFTYDAQWAAIPVGSLIVVYNADEPNPALPADDPSDLNNDSLYVIPHNSIFFERCVTLPASSSPDSIYSPCTYAQAPLNGWNPLSLRNSGDAIQVRNPDGSYFHGVSYGGSEMTGGPHNLKLFVTSGGGMCGWFNDGDFFDVSNWSFGSTGANETPGLPNNALNYEWLKLMRDTNAATCPITLLPVEITQFDGYKLADRNQLVWETATERNSSHFRVERSLNGENWELVGEVTAAGQSNEKVLYRINDNAYRNAVNYYRLIEFDLNGDAIKYNKIVALDNRSDIDNPIVGRFNLTGQAITEDWKGVQILLYKDGTTEKVVNF